MLMMENPENSPRVPPIPETMSIRVAEEVRTTNMVLGARYRRKYRRETIELNRM